MNGRYPQTDGVWGEPDIYPSLDCQEENVSDIRHHLRVVMGEVDA
jgi:hypothetical protein